MNSSKQTGAARFHSAADALFGHAGGVVESKQGKYFVVQEHDVSYRIGLHQHPWVQALTQRLLLTGTPGLQAADNTFLADGSALPGSIVVNVPANTGVEVPARCGLVLLSDVKASAGSATLTLDPSAVLATTGASPVLLPDGARAQLADSLKLTQAVGEALALPATAEATLREDTRIRLPGATAATLADGAAVSLPAGTLLLLPRGTPIRLAAGTLVTLQSSKPMPTLFAEFFGALYGPNPEIVRRPHPAKDLDFSSAGAYAAYNWELFFHVPFTIATHLSKNQRYAEAQRWFHFLFDPTDDSDGPTPERFWKVRPFRSTDVKKLEELLVNLVTGADEDLRVETVRCIEAWQDAPFRPHVIARYRQQAYMVKTVMAYLDNLIAWGDSLFRQDTGEAIDEALMVYVLAANILGPRPQQVPRKGTVRPQTYANLRQDLRQFGTVMRDVEADLPFDLMPAPADAAQGADRLTALRSLGKALYFCVPRNDRLMTYWDTVSDRLFKIRNSLNLQGVFRQLALFEPPIDPALLARAAAAGLDVGAIVNGVNQPLPLVRFQLLAQKALEIVQEVKSLGNSLLAAMEKEDGEALALLRARHERGVLELVEQVKYAQWQESIKSREGLLQTLALAVQRYSYYERQLGNKPEEALKAIPELGELDKEGLFKLNFKMDEPALALRAFDIDIATDVAAQAAQALNGGKLLSSNEVRESLLLEGAQLSSDVANIMNFVSSVAHFVPEFSVHAQPMGVGATTHYGGQEVGKAIGAVASAARAVAERLNFEARRAGRIDAFARREREWAFQSNLAAGDIAQIFKQLRAAQIREAVAEKELANHRQQMANAREIEHFLNEEGTDQAGKKSNRALYAWMKREVKGLYAQCFQLAFDIAKKAERALQHELGLPQASYLQFGYLAGKEGLLAGEKLYLDVKRMELAYLDLNQREYELTKHVSLLQLAPLALVQLRMTGRCTVRLPEALFDMDGPGHYFRRIKTVALSIPCVVGPYAGVNCSLTLLGSSIRKTPALRDGRYEREDAEDERFDDYLGSQQSIVSSSAQNDSGLFETSLRDERYLPFEHAGAVSEWQLELPANPARKDPCQFDYDTISDVVLHLRFTARPGGEPLREAACAAVRTLVSSASGVGMVRLFSLRQDFPSEWARFQHQPAGPDGAHSMGFELRDEHYPYWSRGLLNAVTSLTVLARSTQDPVPASLSASVQVDGLGGAVALGKDANLGNLLAGRMAQDTLPVAPVGSWLLKTPVDPAQLSDCWIAVGWASAAAGR